MTTTTDRPEPNTKPTRTRMATNDALFNTLSFDILANVFLRFTKTECLQCMLVCKAWYAAVPSYTENVWAKLEIYGYHEFVKQTLWLQFIGSHVKNVTFQSFQRQKELYSPVGFIDVTTTKQHLFLPLLWKLTLQSVDMYMLMHHSNVPFLWILKSCPKLTSFSFQYPNRHAFTVQGGFLYYAEPETPSFGYSYPDKIHTGLIDSSQYIHYDDTSPTLNIMDLTIDSTMTSSRLKSIIQQCPNLEYLAYSNDNQMQIFNRFNNHRWFPGSEKFSLNLGLLFSWCPKLKYLCIGNMSYFGNYEIPELYRPLTIFKTYANEDIGPQEIAPTLLRNAATMKHLFLKQVEPMNITIIHNSKQDWEFVLCTFCAPYLRSLILVEIFYGHISALMKSTNQCPLLEIIIIKNNKTNCAHGEGKTINLSNILLQLKQLNHLELVDSFNLKFPVTPTITATTDDNPSMNDDPVPLFRKLTANGTKLETITFGKYVHDLTDTFLLATTYIPTLKHLTLTLSRNRSYKDDGLCLYAELLKLSNAQVESITLYRIRLLPRSFLQSLAALVPLKRVSFSPTSWGNADYRQIQTAASRRYQLHIDRIGYFQMLHQCRCLEMISTFRCKFIEDGRRVSDDIMYYMKMEGLLDHKYELADMFQFSQGNWIFKDI
ncbi:hypothetical protein BDA99DRAFT_554023 [Phascolomyces articulosus]|uniref:F-box domain-containing protein n=1 Tax=Phascolomyces articulosus TaxID=60185 RepID=A0AAD5PK89_9FUNG|nr:hypothetical protein BDA99DRAFT_554023 [Phascolomyces articulosus]